MDSTMLIDATLKHTMPPLALPAREFMEEAKAIWDELQMPPLTLRPPWHGYSLGDWSDTWDRYAKRTTASDWQLTGTETALQQRTDVNPETLVKHED
jgi:4-hydroxy-3-polyprenylbenzoate decarboxylase